MSPSRLLVLVQHNTLKRSSGREWTDSIKRFDAARKVGRG